MKFSGWFVLQLEHANCFFKRKEKKRKEKKRKEKKRKEKKRKKKRKEKKRKEKDSSLGLFMLFYFPNFSIVIL